MSESQIRPIVIGLIILTPLVLGLLGIGAYSVNWSGVPDRERLFSGGAIVLAIVALVLALIAASRNKS